MDSTIKKPKIKKIFEVKILHKKIFSKKIILVSTADVIKQIKCSKLCTRKCEMRMSRGLESIIR